MKPLEGAKKLLGMGHVKAGAIDALSTAATSDDTVSATLSLTYTPIRVVSLDVGVSTGRRDSNISVDDY